MEIFGFYLNKNAEFWLDSRYLGLDIDMNGDEEEERLQVPLDDGSVQEILSSEKKVFTEMKLMWFLIGSMFLNGCDWLNVFEWIGS
jgi:hypothetical protein